MEQVESYFFTDRASLPKQGIAVVCDLEGFSRFFTQPDVSHYVSIYLNHVLSAVDVAIRGGEDYWAPPPLGIPPLRVQPTHIKFLGDGALMIWTPAEGKHDFPSDFGIELCNRLWSLKNGFPKVVRRCAEDVPVIDLPQRIRFGIARGTTYELRYRNPKRAETEYIGFCLNLASRLQAYCREIGFIASARLQITSADLEAARYVKVVAKKLRGFPREIVIVDKDDYEALDDEVRADLFDPLD